MKYDSFRLINFTLFVQFRKNQQGGVSFANRPTQKNVKQFQNHDLKHFACYCKYLRESTKAKAKKKKKNLKRLYLFYLFLV